METYLLILISTVFVNNIVMAKILGLCPFMGVSRKLEAAIGMGSSGWRANSDGAGCADDTTRAVHKSKVPAKRFDFRFFGGREGPNCY